jgi:hypothetical protein
LNYLTLSLTQRKTIFAKFGLPCEFGEAQINALCPLRVVMSKEPNLAEAGIVYGIIFSPTLNKLVIGKGKLHD